MPLHFMNTFQMLLIRGEGGALGPSGDGGVSVLRGGESVEIAAVGEVPSMLWRPFGGDGG